MERLWLLLVALAAVKCCEDQHVCLRRRKIDTRWAMNLSAIHAGMAPALPLETIDIKTDERRRYSTCGFEKLARQVIVKLGASERFSVRDGLGKLGCAVVDYVPRRSWLVFLPERLELDRVRALDGVAWIGEYEPGDKVAPEWDEFFAKILDEESVLFDPEGRVVATVITAAGAVSKNCGGDADRILEALVQHWKDGLSREGGGGIDIEFAAMEGGAVRAAMAVDRAALCVEWLAGQEWVTWIAPAFKGLLGNMVSSAIQQSGAAAPLERGASFSPSRPLWGMGIMGDGQVVGVGDSGVDILSCYFRDEQVLSPGPKHRKILSYRAMWGGDLIDSYGHGSHVAGSLLGNCDQTLNDYTIESSRYNGMAPHAKLVFTDVGIGKNTYVTPPMDLSDYF